MREASCSGFKVDADLLPPGRAAAAAAAAGYWLDKIGVIN